MVEDCKQYVSKCVVCLKQQGGKRLTLAPKNIETKGSKERYVADGWKLFKEISEST